MAKSTDRVVEAPMTPQISLNRIGRRPLLVGCTVLMLVSACPVMFWLVSNLSFRKLLVVELWLSFLFGSYNGAAIVFMSEIIPIEVRTLGFSLGYSIATSVFGGFTPAVSTYLIDVTGNRAAPGWWLSGAAAVGLTAALLSGARDRSRDIAVGAAVPVGIGD